MDPIRIPPLIAGPIVRRAERGRIVLWIATQPLDGRRSLGTDLRTDRLGRIMERVREGILPVAGMSRRRRCWALNIMDGMDAARFTSGNPAEAPDRASDAGERNASRKKKPPSTPDMPQVLRNLNNK